MKHELGDQWIEDGHMYKAIVGKSNCLGCSHNDGSVRCEYKNIIECEEGQNFIIFDLGPVNEDGLLPSIVDGKYPRILPPGMYESGVWIEHAYCTNRGKVTTSVYGLTLQEAKDLWNRRA